MQTRQQSKSAKADLQAWKDGNLSFYSLDHRRLRPGDVLLENSSSSVSTLIRWADEGKFSHAMIYAGGGQIVEAVLRGTVFLSIRRIVTRSPDRWLHLRPRTALTPDREAMIQLAIRAHAFKSYALLGVLGTKAKPLQGVQGDRSLFCSQLVALAYESVGIPVVPGNLPETVTPNMLLRDASILASVPGTPFAVMAVRTAEDLKAALELENRDEAIQGTEVDQNRLIDQEAVRVLEPRFKNAGDFVDGYAHAIANLSELLAHVQAMKPGPGREVSDLLDALLRERGYFDLFQASLAKSHVPDWEMKLAELWLRDRQVAMRFLGEVFDASILVADTAKRFRADAGAIDASLAERLPIFATFRDNYLRMASKLESHCAEVEMRMLVAYDATEIAKRRGLA